MRQPALLSVPLRFFSKIGSNSTLTAVSARSYFERLRLFLAIQKEASFPEEGEEPYSALFYSDGRRRIIRWMPHLEERDWRRLQYNEFCAHYGLPPYGKEKGEGLPLSPGAIVP